MSEGLEIGQRLRALRMERRLTLRELATRVKERTGVRLAFSYISRLEHGGVARPGLRTIEALAAGLDVSLEALAPELRRGTELSAGPATDPQSASQYGPGYGAGYGAVADTGIGTGTGDDTLTAQEKEEIEGLVQGVLQLTPEGRRYVASLVERMRQEEQSHYWENLRASLERRKTPRQHRPPDRRRDKAPDKPPANTDKEP